MPRDSSSFNHFFFFQQSSKEEKRKNEASRDEEISFNDAQVSKLTRHSGDGAFRRRVCNRGGADILDDDDDDFILLCRIFFC